MPHKTEGGQAPQLAVRDRGHDAAESTVSLVISVSEGGFFDGGEGDQFRGRDRFGECRERAERVKRLCFGDGCLKQ